MSENRILELPILPLRNTVIFPSGITPLTVGRPLSLAAAEAALSTEEKLLGVVAQREDNETEPTPDNLYKTGTVVVINRMMRSPGAEEVLHLIVQGQERFRIVEFTGQTPHLKARVEVLPEPVREKTPEVEALQRNIQVLVQKALSLLPNVPPEIRNIIVQADDAVRLAYFLGSVLDLNVTQEQALLEADTESEVLHLMHSYLSREVEVLEIRSKIANQAQEELGKAQRDFILREQMKQIQKELGETEPEQAEAALLRERIAKAFPHRLAKSSDAPDAALLYRKVLAAQPDASVVIVSVGFLSNLRSLLDTAANRTVAKRDPYAGVFHAAIMWGFIVLFIGTAILTLESDIIRPLAPQFSFYWGAFYLGYSLVLDILGLVMLVGIGAMAIRRARRPPP